MAGQEENSPRPGHDSAASSSSMSSQQTTSSSSSSAPCGRPSRKPKKPPPLTPNRLSRFFNPPSSRLRASTLAARQVRQFPYHGAGAQSNTAASRNAHPRDLSTASATKRRKTSSESKETSSSQDYLSSGSPCPSFSPHPHSSSDREQDLYLASLLKTFKEPIRRAKISGLSQRAPNWRHFTAQFMTGPEDVHVFQDTIPFCTKACNTNSLVAIGDQDGHVRILEAAEASTPAFDRNVTSFASHLSAVTDMAFSSDDYCLATGSADESICIIDMRTQKRLHKILEAHHDSLKKLAFQPGHDSILATTSRDGDVRLWDLRCNVRQPQLSVDVKDEEAMPVSVDGRSELDKHDLDPINFSAIIGGHQTHPKILADRRASSQRSVPKKHEASVTSLSFLRNSHQFITATEIHAMISLWDIRQSHKQPAIPLSRTAPVPAHVSTRHFGITDLVLSNDGARTYSICKDSTVYVYSTNHIALGQPIDDNRRHVSGWQNPDNRGLAPLYGFKHWACDVSSFYVGASVRKGVENRSELLAVGSGLGQPCLFPTDEKLIQDCVTEVNPEKTGVPSLSRSFRQGLVGGPNTPIYRCGTVLRYGHESEASSVAWSLNGELVTISNDCTARRWRERPAEDDIVRDLRWGKPVVNRYEHGFAKTSDGDGFGGRFNEWDEDES